MLTRENTFLIEFVPGDQGQVQAPVIRNDGTSFTYFGLKVMRIIDGNCEVLSQYTVEDDCCSIDCLVGKEGYWVASVAAPDSKQANFHWVLWQIDAINPETTQLVFRSNIRNATEEEVVILNEIFPEYLENCYYDEKERVK